MSLIAQRPSWMTSGFPTMQRDTGLPDREGHSHRGHTVIRLGRESWVYLEEHTFLPREEDGSGRGGGFDKLTIDFYRIFGVWGLSIENNVSSNIDP